MKQNFTVRGALDGRGGIPERCPTTAVSGAAAELGGDAIATRRAAA